MQDTRNFPPTVGGSNAIYGQSFAFGEVAVSIRTPSNLLTEELDGAYVKLTAKTEKNGPILFTKEIPLELVAGKNVVPAWSLTEEDWATMKNPVAMASQNLIIFVDLYKEEGILPIPLFQYIVNVFRNYTI